MKNTHKHSLTRMAEPYVDYGQAFKLMRWLLSFFSLELAKKNEEQPARLPRALMLIAVSRCIERNSHPRIKMAKCAAVFIWTMDK